MSFQQQQQQALSTSQIARFSEIFDAYADTKATPQGPPCMTPAAFVRAVTPSAETAVAPKNSPYAVFFTIADREGRGLLTKDDFIEFQALLSQQDAASRLPFRAVSFSANTDTIQTSALASLVSDDAAARNYLKGKSHISYAEFAQLIASARADRIRNAFSAVDVQGSGSINPDKLCAIVSEFAPIDPASTVAQRILLLRQSVESPAVGYPTFLALVSLLSNPINIHRAIDEVVHRQSPKAPVSIDKLEISQSEFAGATSLLTPLEISVLFTLAAGQAATEATTLDSINAVLDACYTCLAPVATEKGPVEKVPAHQGQQKPSRGAMRETLFQAYNFAIGAVAGGIGAAVVYPIDLVKTRMQNQRAAVVGEMMYKNSLDCFRKVIRNEGVLGLYRGLGPQLVGVAPEKAIKLTVNDFMRARLTSKDTGNIAFANELIAGASAGASQVIFTNPLEIVKIRLQIQGEILKDAAGVITPIARHGAVTIVKELGLVGLYKGASACLLRDVPFSAIYFSCYSHLKKDVFREGERQLGVVDLLLAGAIAGMPAAYLTTPADVIKTRLQVVAKKGETAYNGLFDAARKIYKEEGFKAFFKGGPARILRSSPQFGTTLMCYELIHRMVPFPGEGHNPTSDRSSQKTHELSSQTALFHAGSALRLLHDANYKFGTMRPPQAPFSPSSPSS